MLTQVDGATIVLIYMSLCCHHMSDMSGYVRVWGNVCFIGVQGNVCFIGVLSETDKFMENPQALRRDFKLYRGKACEYKCQNLSEGE